MPGIAAGGTGFFPFPVSVRKQRPGKNAALLQNFQHCAFFTLDGSGAQNGAHGPGRAPLLADNLAQVLFGDLELKNRRLLAFYFADLHFFGIIHQGFGNVFYQGLHVYLQWGSASGPRARQARPRLKRGLLADHRRF